MDCHRWAGKVPLCELVCELWLCSSPRYELQRIGARIGYSASDSVGALVPVWWEGVVR